MRLSLTRAALRRSLFVTTALLLGAILPGLILPYNHPLQSFIPFQRRDFLQLQQIPLKEQRWYFGNPKHPVDFDQDVGLLIRTGYGTKQLLRRQMHAMGLDGTSEGVIVVGEYSAHLEDGDITIDVLDVVGDALEEQQKAGKASPPRSWEYHEIKKAIDTGNIAKAQDLSIKNRRLLDPAKIIFGLERAYTQASSKKWWIILDDDTMLLKASIEKLLARLDPAEDHYFGSKITRGQIDAEHQKGVVVLSQRTLVQLFDRSNAVLEWKSKSLSDHKLGSFLDTLLSKLGVEFDDRFTSFFSDVAPKNARVNETSFCSPLASLSGLTNPELMTSVGKRFEEHGRKMVFWGALWHILQEPDMATFNEHPIRPDHDHVGPPDEYIDTFDSIPSALDCLKLCDVGSDTCLAWTWAEDTKECYLAPFVAIGYDVTGKYSGVHFPRAKAIGDQCGEKMRRSGCFRPGADCGI